MISNPNKIKDLLNRMTGFKFKKRTTQKPLSMMVPELLTFIQREEQNRTIFNEKLFEIFNGGLLKYVEESLSKELSPRAFSRAKERIPPCNILKKYIDKVSRVYNEGCERETSNEIDEELLEFYAKELDVDQKMSSGNELLNLSKYFAVEPYLDGNVPSLRIIPGHQFLVYSDSPTDPTKMTVFVKFMGAIKKDGVPSVDRLGKLVRSAEENARLVKLFYIYSDSEFMVLDADGQIHENRTNPYNKIPFVFCSSSTFELLPTPDSDNLSMSVLIPKLLGDLNYSAQFCSHSIMYGIDVDVANLDSSPDAFWSVNSSSKEGASPSIGTIAPTVDIAQVLELINAQMALWLDCKGVKVSSTGGASVQDAASGVSKMIDSSDSSSIIKKQMKMFESFELYFWDLLKTMHNFWVSNSMLSEQLPAFSDDFNPSIKFGEVKIIPSKKEQIEEIKNELDIGTTTVKRAIQKLNPDFSWEQVEAVYLEIQQEKNDRMTFNMDNLVDKTDKKPEEEIDKEDQEDDQLEPKE